MLTNPQDWASKLVTWVQNAKSQGVPIYAVSGENEPDRCVVIDGQLTKEQVAARIWATVNERLDPTMAPVTLEDSVR